MNTQLKQTFESVQNLPLSDQIALIKLIFQDLLEQPLKRPQAIDTLVQLLPKPKQSPAPKQMTAQDLLESEFVGMWADRDDLGDSLTFARQLRRQAETRSHHDFT